MLDHIYTYQLGAIKTVCQIIAKSCQLKQYKIGDGKIGNGVFCLALRLTDCRKIVVWNLYGIIIEKYKYIENSIDNLIDQIFIV